MAGATDYAQMTVRQLKTELNRRNLSGIGSSSITSLPNVTKRELIERLQQADATYQKNGKVAFAILKAKVQAAAPSEVVDVDPQAAKWSWSGWEWSSWRSCERSEWSTSSGSKWNASIDGPAGRGPAAGSGPVGSGPASSGPQLLSRKSVSKHAVQRSWSQEMRRRTDEEWSFRHYNMNLTEAHSQATHRQP